MKIMFLTLSLRNGGAERVLANLSNEMVKKNDVTVVTVHNNKDHYELDSKVKRICLDKRIQSEKSELINKLQKLSFGRIRKLVEIISDESPDVVIAFLPLPSLYLMMAKRLSKKIRKIPAVLSERADPNKEYCNKLVFIAMKKLFKHADGFVFQTEEAKSFYDGIIGCRTAIIANPINELFLSHKMPKTRRKVIASCGRLEKQKNYELLIRSFAEVVKSYPEYSLEIYGDGSQKDELIRITDELGVGNKVGLMGRVVDVVDKIADAGVFVLSSNYEGMPNALMEAMALGIPCVSTDCPVGGPRALIENGENGFLVKVNNKSQLADAIMKIIIDNELALKFSKNERISSEQYTVEKIAGKWSMFISAVVASEKKK